MVVVTRARVRRRRVGDPVRHRPPPLAGRAALEGGRGRVLRDLRGGRGPGRGARVDAGDLGRLGARRRHHGAGPRAAATDDLAGHGL